MKKYADKPSDDILYTYYILENRTQRDIGETFGVSRRVVCGWLKKAGLRKHLDVPGDLKELYIQQGMSHDELAEHYGVEPTHIRSWIGRAKLRKVVKRK